MSDTAQAAKLIRQDLRRIFPDTRFKVSYRTWRELIVISYRIGPEPAEVENALRKYEYASFDSRIDSFVADNVIEDLPQVRNVFVFKNQPYQAEFMLR